MTSSINPERINTEFPVAGIDNDSQGFRTNFTNTAANFEAARDEIEDLQNKAILKVPLNGEVGVDNDMVDTQLRAPQLVDSSETIKNHELQSGPVVLRHTDAHYHIIETTDPISLSFLDWPPEQMSGRMRVEVNVTDSSHYIDLPEEVSVGIEGIAGYDPAAHSIKFGIAGLPSYVPGIHIFEFTTWDHGTTVAINDILRNKNNLAIGTVLKSTGQEGDKRGTFMADGGYLYVCIQDYDPNNIVDIWVRVQLDQAPWDNS